MQPMSTCLWFDHEAESAAAFYTGIIPNSRILSVAHYGEAGAKAAKREAGSVMMVIFELNGSSFMAMNAGSQFRFTPAISLVVNVETQDELDAVYDRLVEGGQPQPCGWLTDKYGLSWQITPMVLGKLMSSGDPARSERVFSAMLKMTKLDIATLEQAAEEA